ncbi:hypothetical protein ACOMHN_050475 [Nucella lapillus]
MWIPRRWNAALALPAVVVPSACQVTHTTVTDWIPGGGGDRRHQQKDIQGHHLDVARRLRLLDAKGRINAWKGPHSLLSSSPQGFFLLYNCGALDCDGNATNGIHLKASDDYEMSTGKGVSSNVCNT